MDDKKGKKGLVIFKDFAFCVSCEELYRPMGSNLGWSKMINGWYGEIEIIGNIHDNPELI